jgi:ABC-type molybdate transport system permease subunit
MPLSKNDLDAILLTLELASLTTVLLLIIGTPIALWPTPGSNARSVPWWPCRWCCRRR